MKMNLKLNMAAMSQDASPKEEEKPTPTVPSLKPLAPNFSLSMPKLNLNPEPVPAHKEETVAEEKQQRIKVDLLVANLLDVKVDAKADEHTRKKIVTEEVKKKFKLQKGDKLSFDIFTLGGESNGEYTYVCKPKTDVQLTSLLEIKQQNEDLRVKLEKTANALLVFEQQNAQLREQLRQRDETISLHSQKQEQHNQAVETLKKQHEELENILQVTPPTPAPVSLKLNLNKL